MYKIVWEKSAEKGFKKIDIKTVERIVKRVENTLAENPYHGEPLTGIYKGLYKFRIGDYRVVYQILNNVLIVRVVKIGHRKEVYN